MEERQDTRGAVSLCASSVIFLELLWSCSTSVCHSFHISAALMSKSDYKDEICRGGGGGATRRRRESLMTI